MVQKKRTTKKSTKNERIYILDTNILVHDPSALFSFDGAFVGIPSIVIEELEKFKREGTERGRNTREAIRNLDGLRSKGVLGQGVKLDNGSIIQVLFATKDMPELPFILPQEDNNILTIAYAYLQRGYDVRFISKDLNARVKADALGILAEDYLEEHVSAEDFYHGWLRVAVPSIQLKNNQPKILQELLDEYDFSFNEFVLLESKGNPQNYRVFRYVGKKGFLPISAPSIPWPFQARNAQQLMALDVLMDDSIQMVSLLGPAGTGKTFLALISGMFKVLVQHTYDRMLVSRPVVPLGKDLGYLPGDLQEKLHNWMMPIYDNMDFIMHTITGSRHFSQEGDPFERPRKKFKGKDKYKGKSKDKDKKGKKDRIGMLPIQELIRHGKISMEAITYMRGRTIPYQFILIDEAQNLTPHEVKTLVTRAGEGSKVILAGDPYQIDAPYLDFSSNGLVTASEKFRDNKIFASVYLETSERSELSKLAGEIL